MDYVGSIYRPPSEAHSLLLQVTVGCSHNRCSFCQMYRGKRFRTKPFAQIEADLVEATRVFGDRVDRVFLCDGDSLILSTRRLLGILTAIRTHLPSVVRVGTYGDSRSVLEKSVGELIELRDAGLGIVYHGMESGDDEVLARIEKGGSRAEAIATAERLHAAGITHSVMVLLGIGGADRSGSHARESASALTAMDPRYVGALTVTVVPGTPLHQQQAAGAFALPGKFAMLEELRTIVAESRFTNTRFSANHASNYLPLTADLPREKDQLVGLLDTVLRRRDERLLRPEAWRRL